MDSLLSSRYGESHQRRSFAGVGALTPLPWWRRGQSLDYCWRLLSNVGRGFNITAFFRAAGSLSVLASISISVDFTSALVTVGQVEATAASCTMHPEVKSRLCSSDFSEHILNASLPDGSNFQRQLTAGDWGEYCNAFGLKCRNSQWKADAHIHCTTEWICAGRTPRVSFSSRNGCGSDTRPV